MQRCVLYHDLHSLQNHVMFTFPARVTNCIRDLEIIRTEMSEVTSVGYSNTRVGELHFLSVMHPTTSALISEDTKNLILTHSDVEAPANEKLK
jgi:hypothetical protein